MVTLNLADPAQQTFLYRARCLRIFLSVASIGFQFAANPTKFCILSFIALLQCLESLESGQGGT